MESLSRPDFPDIEHGVACIRKGKGLFGRHPETIHDGCEDLAVPDRSLDQVQRIRVKTDRRNGILRLLENGFDRSALAARNCQGRPENQKKQK